MSLQQYWHRLLDIIYPDTASNLSYAPLSQSGSQLEGHERSGQDEAAQFATQIDEESPSQQEMNRVRNKIDWHLMPLMCSKWRILDREAFKYIEHRSSLLRPIHR